MNSSNGVGPSRDEWTILSPTIAKEIQKVYNFSSDLIIGIATDIIKREAFHGGMTYVVQEKSKEPQDFDADSEVWVEHTMQKALDYYYQYGMCPVMNLGRGSGDGDIDDDDDGNNKKDSKKDLKKEKKKQIKIPAITPAEAGLCGPGVAEMRREQTTQKVNRFIIPSIDSGHFLARMTYDGQVEVGFQLHRFAGRRHPTFVSGRGVSPTPGIYVYVWPGRTPVPNSPTPFRSLVYRLLPTQLNMRELWQNDMDASHVNSRPSLILVRTQKNGGQPSMDQETELSIFADALSVSSGSSSMQHQRGARSDSEFTSRLQTQLRRMREMSGGGSKRMGVDGRLVGADIIRYQNWEDGNVFFAPSGMTTSTPVMAQRETNITQRSEWWQRIVAQQFGVPMQYLDRGSSGHRPGSSSSGSSANLTSGQTDACALLRKTVQEARKRMVSFFEAAYDVLFRNGDTDRLVSKIITGRHRLKTRKETIREYELHLSGRPQQLQQAMIDRQQEEMKWMAEESRLRTVINRVFNMALERTSLALDSSMIARVAQEELDRDRNEVNHLKDKVLPAKRRFLIKWRQPILIDVTMLNWMFDKGFIDDDAMREIVLREFGLPDDTPRGIPIEERMAILEQKYAPKEPTAAGGSTTTTKTKKKPVTDTTKSQSKKISAGVKPKEKRGGQEPKKKKQKTTP